MKFRWNEFSFQMHGGGHGYGHGWGHHGWGWGWGHPWGYSHHGCGGGGGFVPGLVAGAAIGSATSASDQHKDNRRDSAAQESSSQVAPPSAPVRPPPAFHSHARLKKAFNAEHESELSVSAGELVEIISDSMNGWSFVVSASSGRQGYVPTAFLDVQTN